jgi:ATP-dependent Clp protease ATP-binding subunit ClpB
VNERNKQGIMETTKIEVMDQLKKSVRPEFLNRIDDIILFAPLMENEIEEIVRVQLKSLEKMLAKNNIRIEVKEEAVKQLANEGFDPQFGARPLKRVIQKDIINELSKRILAGQVESDQKIVIDSVDGEIVFWNPKEQKVEA